MKKYGLPDPKVETAWGLKFSEKPEFLFTSIMISSVTNENNF